MSAAASSSSSSAESPPWTAGQSSLLYRVKSWGAPYFAVNDRGNVSVRPHGVSTADHQVIDLLEVVKKASDPETSGGFGLTFPLIVRFPDVLNDRLKSLQSSFNSAIQSNGYGAHYQGVYPVKCNQHKFVVEDIVKFDPVHKFGLEVGSKPELLLAMSCLCEGSDKALLICNGFKDKDYISLALMARKLRLNTIIVLEQEEELDLVIEVSEILDIEPVIGFRAKLNTKHWGHFGSTSGKNGKFGLTIEQILRVVEKLRVKGKLGWLQLLHFHIGSQIPSTKLLAKAVVEAAKIYCKLVDLGACMKYIDIGGGLGIDYDGSKSTSSKMSVGYSLQDYALTVVRSIRNVCDRRDVSHPVICSESGRAIVSHHSILVFDVFSTTSHKSPVVPTSYHVNLSVFTSIPDFWGIKQLFPVIPIHRLDEKPKMKGILSDLTCDSDGRVDKFIGKKSSLPLHELKRNEAYYLGMFLGGAYQEALGGVHNLFGRPSVVHVSQRDGPESFNLRNAVPGSSCEDVLWMMHYDPDEMRRTLRIMSQTLNDRAGDDDGGGGGCISSEDMEYIDRSFKNMPYLV